jgi:hypothetical protein
MRFIRNDTPSRGVQGVGPGTLYLMCLQKELLQYAILICRRQMV